MTDDRQPESMDATIMRAFREEVRRGIERNLRNIYLYNVSAWCSTLEVKNACQMSLQPDEYFMSLVETRACVTKEESDIWRKSVSSQWKLGKTEHIDRRLGWIFQSLADSYQLVQKLLVLYPNDMRIEEKVDG